VFYFGGDTFQLLAVGQQVIGSVGIFGILCGCECVRAKKKEREGTRKEERKREKERRRKKEKREENYYIRQPSQCRLRM